MNRCSASSSLSCMVVKFFDAANLRCGVSRSVRATGHSVHQSSPHRPFACPAKRSTFFVGPETISRSPALMPVSGVA